MVVHIFLFKRVARIISCTLTTVIAFLYFSPFCISACAAEPDREAAAAKMTRGLYNFESEIDMSGCGVTPQNVGEIFIFVIKNDPYLFFVSTKLSYIYKSDGKMTVFPKYTMSADEAAKAILFCKSEVGRMASAVDPRMSDAEKALFVHDLICAEFSYDLTYTLADMSGFLSGRMGTCQGYTWTYMAVLRELSIECCYVASDTINHIWNMVKIDGEWYHCDLTWDDGGEMRDRRHFLCSDKKAIELGHRDWYSAYGEACPSEKYDTADMSALTHDLYSGDADHSGKTELYDLLSVTVGNDESFCQMCADVNGDLVCDGHDADALRDKLLGINCVVLSMM